MSAGRTLPDDERLAVCAAIAELKEKLRTEAAVAEALDISQQAVGLALRSRHQAGPNIQRKVADHLGLTRDGLTQKYAPRARASAADADDPYPTRTAVGRQLEELGVISPLVREYGNRAMRASPTSEHDRRAWADLFLKEQRLFNGMGEAQYRAYRFGPTAEPTDVDRAKFLAIETGSGRRQGPLQRQPKKGQRSGR